MPMALERTAEALGECVSSASTHAEMIEKKAQVAKKAAHDGRHRAHEKTHRVKDATRSSRR
jgi:hypothetical protein